MESYFYSLLNSGQVLAKLMYGGTLITIFVILLSISIFVIRVLAGKYKDLRYQSFFTLLTLTGVILIWWVVDYFMGCFVPEISSYTNSFLYIAWWSILAFTINEFIEFYIWDMIFVMDGKSVIPTFIRRLTAGLIYALTIIAIIGLVFEGQTAVLYAFLGGATFILGYAASEVIAEMFAGLALNVAPVFRKGDTISIEDQELEVVDMNWRFTTLISDKNNFVYISNSDMIGSKIQNYTIHSRPAGIALQFKTPIDVPPQLVIDLLKDNLPQIPEFITDPALATEIPDPLEINILEFGEHGILYEAAFFIQKYLDYPTAKTNAYKIIWYVFQKYNIPLYMSDIHLHYESGEKPKRLWEINFSLPQIVSILKKVREFASLTDEELTLVAQNAKQREYAPPQYLITYHAHDDSLFAIAHGEVSIAIPQEDGSLLHIKSMKAGDSVGIMALMTGEPRSAHVIAQAHTIAYEIDRSVLKPILEKAPQRIEQIVQSIAAMEEENLKKSSEYSEDAAKRAKALEEFRNTLIGKIREFFGLLD